MRFRIDKCEMKNNAIDCASWPEFLYTGASAMLIHRGLQMLIAGSILLAPCAGFAGPPENVTPQEKALLPEFCKYTQGALGGNEKTWDPSPGARYWMSVLGGGPGQGAYLWVMHHYCYALIHMNRARRARLSNSQRIFEWGMVVDEIDFIFGYAHPSSDFILMPEMMLNRGRALMRLKRPDQAIEDFKKSIESKVDYWPPYLEIADYYVSVGAKAKAISILREGLVNAPDAKALKQRLTELGGAVPPPRAKEEVPPPANPSSDNQ